MERQEFQQRLIEEVGDEIARIATNHFRERLAGGDDVVFAILEDGKGGGGYCSATVVSDPANPGRSNLVYTASHCLHEGKGGKFFLFFSVGP